MNQDSVTEMLNRCPTQIMIQYPIPRKASRQKRKTVLRTKNWWNIKTDLKLIQGSIWSISQLLPHRGKVHRMLNHFMIVRKLQKQSLLSIFDTSNDFQKQTDILLKQIPHTSSGSTGSAYTPYVSFLPTIQTRNNNKQPINIIHQRDRDRDKITHFCSLSRINSNDFLSGNGTADGWWSVGVPDQNKE